MSKTIVDENGDFISGPILKIGGLFRCCLETWQKEIGSVADDVDRIVCAHCSEPITRLEKDPEVWGWVSSLSLKGR